VTEARELVARRAAAQRLTGPALDTPEAVVGWFGAVQAQEYHFAKWCLSQRTGGFTEAEVERAVAEGRILRTHVLRPTWHFLLPSDIRWVLALSGPRVHAVNRPYYRKAGLDEATLARGHEVVVAELAGGRHRTRTELAEALRTAGIDKQGPELAYLIIHAELEGLICSGAPRGKQQTYALLSERAPDTAPLERDEAITQLVVRFFTSHGPATVKDFVWWSGLTGADARGGLARAGDRVRSEEANGREYWSAADPLPTLDDAPAAHLLQVLDEYVVGYTESRDLLDRESLSARREGDQLAFTHAILVDTQVAGHWKRTLKARSAVVEASLYRPLSDDHMAALRVEAERYARFVERPVELVVRWWRDGRWAD
jgi:hypothetical protein